MCEQKNYSAEALKPRLKPNLGGQVIPLPVIPVSVNPYEVVDEQQQQESAVIEASNELLSIIKEINNSTTSIENDDDVEYEDDEIEIINFIPGKPFDYSKVKVKTEPID